MWMRVLPSSLAELLLTTVIAPMAPTARSASLQESPATPVVSPALEVTVPAFPNKSCPIMGKPASSKLFTDTAYGRIWICCKGCNKKIAQDEATAWKHSYPTVTKLENALCPVTGKKIEGEPTLLQLQGYELRLHSAECVAAARADSQVVLAKAIQPELVDVANANCPITGKPVSANTFCVVAGQIVRLSSAECVDGVKKDPKSALDKALADARAVAGRKQ